MVCTAYVRREPVESERMIQEAYAATKAAPPDPDIRYVKKGWETSRQVLGQMLNMNLISKATYLDHIEAMVP